MAAGDAVVQAQLPSNVVMAAQPAGEREMGHPIETQGRAEWGQGGRAASPGAPLDGKMDYSRNLGGGGWNSKGEHNRSDKNSVAVACLGQQGLSG